MLKTMPLFRICLMLSACGAPNQTSQQDISRQQRSSYALAKSLELSPLSGFYQGWLKADNGHNQRIQLELALREKLDENDADIDVQHVPRLGGFLVLGVIDSSISQQPFKGSSGAIGPTPERLAIIHSEYDKQLQEVYLSVQHELLGQIDLTLNSEISQKQQILAGKWLAQKSSMTGRLSLIKSPSSEQVSRLPTPINLVGVYQGFLNRATNQKSHWAKITIQRSLKDPQNHVLQATLLVHRGSQDQGEYQSYRYPDVFYHPLSGQLVLQDREAKIEIKGMFDGQLIKGTWSHALLGEMGGIELSQDEKNLKTIKELSLVDPISSHYYSRLNPLVEADARLPSKAMLSLFVQADSEGAERSRLTANMRFYDAELSSPEVLDFSLSSVFFDLITGDISLNATLPFPLSVTGKMTQNGIEGQMRYGATGLIIPLVMSKEQPKEQLPSLAGNYRGFFRRSSNQGYFPVSLEVLSHHNSELKLSASLSLYFAGDFGGKYLHYHYANIDFDASRSLISAPVDNLNIGFQVRYQPSRLSGSWYGKKSGKIGDLVLCIHQSCPMPGEGEIEKSPIGLYRGKVTNSNSQTSLPESVSLQISGSREANLGEKFELFGEIRFYIGSNSSHEYVEYPLHHVYYNPFSNEFSARTRSPNLFIQGRLYGNKMTGRLSHDGFGDIGPLVMYKE